MNRVLPFLVRTSIIAAVLFVLYWLLGLVLPGVGMTEEAGGIMNRIILPLLSSCVLAAALAYPIGRSRLQGKELFGAVFLALFGLTVVLTLVEAALFLTMTAGELWVEVIRTTLSAAVLSWLAVRLYPKLPHEIAVVEQPPNPPSTASWTRRWIGVSMLYVVLYFTAGLLILPIIKSWYEELGTLEPDLAFFFPFQIARGALFVACVLPLLRSMEVTRRQSSLAMAVMIPLVHGVAGLIPPNPFMPDYVRYAHMVEIGWSNFVLGLLIGYLFWKPPLSQADSAPAEVGAAVLQHTEGAV